MDLLLVQRVATVLAVPVISLILWVNQLVQIIVPTDIQVCALLTELTDNVWHHQDETWLCSLLDFLGKLLAPDHSEKVQLQLMSLLVESVVKAEDVNRDELGELESNVFVLLISTNLLGELPSLFFS